MKRFIITVLGWLLALGYVQAAHFVNMNSEKDVYINSKFHLIAHRGGVVEGKNLENSLAALDEAIKRGYTGAEIDVRQSKDGKLFLYHNRTFERDYESKGRGADMTWKEIQELRPLKEGAKAPVSMEEYCKYAQGKLKELMIDIKIDKPTLSFYQELERILKETGFLNSSYFIGHGEYFRGKGPLITMLIREIEDFSKLYGEKIKDYFFLFAGVDEINGKTIKWAKDHNIMIMCCENLPWMKMESDNFQNAERNIEWLINSGIVYYQIDSDYDIFFRDK